MPRRATGSVVKRARKGGTFYGIRFTLPNGQRKFTTLGAAADGWTQRAAEDELANTLADIRRGTWHDPNTPETVIEDAPETPSFHEFSSEWLARQCLEGGRRGTGLADKSREDLEWRLSCHLLPAFRHKRLDQITRDDVDRFRTGKVAEAKAIRDAAAAGKPALDEYTDRRGCKHRRLRRALSPASINKLIATLAAILEDAVDRELIPRNVAAGRKRKLRTAAPERAWLDRASHITALLAATGEIDEKALERKGSRRAILATLIYGGLRISEALALRWQDLDLAENTLRVKGSKTAAANRTINIRPALARELKAYQATVGLLPNVHSLHAHKTGQPEPTVNPDSLMFPTSTGAAQSKQNIRNRVLQPAISKANKQLAKQGEPPIPDGLTHHGLRRTYASILFALGESPVHVKQQMGHTTANLTLAVYAQEMDRRDAQPDKLKALVEGTPTTPTTANKGTRVPNQHDNTQKPAAAATAKTQR